MLPLPTPMKTPPFFCTDPPAEAGGSSPLAATRLPFHDNFECPIGQDVKLNRHWQYYEPKQMAETRPRCPLCIELTRAGK